MLLGREVEIARVSGHLERVLVVRGEAGIGKSSLLEVAADAAAGRGERILRVGGVEAETGIPLAGVHQLLYPLRPFIEQVPSSAAVVLSRVLALDVDSATGSAALGSALLELLDAAGRAQPVFLVLDDAHWFDEASASALLFALRRAGHGGIATVRSDIRSPFDAAGLDELDLSPLTDADAAAVVRARFPDLADSDIRTVLDEAEGNPLALIELPRVGTRIVPGGAAPLSHRLESLYAGRISALAPAVRAELLLAALDGLGSTTTPRRSVVEARMRHVDDALESGLVALEPTSGSLGFRHPLVRSALIGRATANERRDAHSQLAVLHAADPERRARHLSAATVDPDDDVAEALDVAAHIASRRGGSGTAIDLLARAAELSVRPAARSRRLAEAAFLASQAARLDDADRLAHAARQSDTGDAAAAIVTSAYAALYRDGDVRSTHRSVVETLRARSGELDDESIERLINLLLVISLFGGDPDAWAITEQLVEQHSGALRSNTLLTARAFSDVARHGAGLRDDLRVAFADAEQGEPWEVMRLSVGAFFLDMLDEVRPLVGRAAERERDGAVSNRMVLLQVLALDQLVSGRWAEAEVTASDGVALTEQHGYTLFGMLFRVFLTLLAGMRGDRSETERLRAEVDAWAGPRGVAYFTEFVRSGTVIERLGRGDYAGAYAEATAIAEPGTFRRFGIQPPRTILDLVEAAMRCGHEEEARRHVEAAREASLSTISSRLQLQVAAATALTAPSDVAFATALALPAAALFPFETARVRLAYGEWLRRDRQAARARGELTEAAAMFDRLGAATWSQRAHAELRAAGVASAAPTASALTPQERQIVELAATGLSNKEIGERLFLSPRTVSSHLYRIFPKLGVTSRSALRDALAGDDDAVMT